MNVFLAYLFRLQHLLLPFFAVIVNKQEQNSFRVLNVQNYVPNYYRFIDESLTNTESGTAILIGVLLYIINFQLKFSLTVRLNSTLEPFINQTQDPFKPTQMIQV